jgi:hypothetical protein
MGERCVQSQPSGLLGDGAERCSARSARYVVRELERFAAAAAAGGRTQIGLSVHVLDRLTGYRCVASWRSEEISVGGHWPRSRGDHYMRDTAAEHAAKLNAQHEATL